MCHKNILILFFLFAHFSCGNKNMEAPSILKHQKMPLSVVDCEKMQFTSTSISDENYSETLAIYDEWPIDAGSDILVRLSVYTPISVDSTRFSIYKILKIGNCAVMIKKTQTTDNEYLTFRDISSIDYFVSTKVISTVELDSINKLCEALKEAECPITNKVIGMPPYFTVEIPDKECNFTFVTEFDWENNLDLVKTYKKVYEKEYDAILLYNKLHQLIPKMSQME